MGSRVEWRTRELDSLVRVTVSSCQSGLMQNSTHGISEVVPF